MNQTNSTLKTAERLIQERFPGHFGDGYSIEKIVGSSFTRKGHDVHYITVHLAPGCPPLGHGEANEFDILLKEELVSHDIFDWPAVAFVTQDGKAT